MLHYCQQTLSTPPKPLCSLQDFSSQSQMLSLFQKGENVISKNTCSLIVIAGVHLLDIRLFKFVFLQNVNDVSFRAKSSKYVVFQKCCLKCLGPSLNVKKLNCFNIIVVSIFIFHDIFFPINPAQHRFSTPHHHHPVHGFKCSQTIS